MSVRDLFGSMPVRIKQRPTVGDGSVLEKEWSQLCRDMVALVLPWSSSVSISVREIATGQELRLRPEQDQRRSRHANRHSSSLTAKISRILVQAHLADSSHAPSWERVSGTSEGIHVRGCISLNPTATRRAQFVCIGIQPIPNEAGEVYDELNRVFANSNFAMGDEHGETIKSSVISIKSKRVVDRWPMFYFQVDAGRSRKQLRKYVENILDERCKVEPMVELLKGICHSFLKRHHHQPQELLSARGSRRKRFIEKDKGTPSGDGGPSSLKLSPFDTWSRIKRGRAINISTEGRKSASERNSAASSTSIWDGVGEGNARQASSAAEKVISDSGTLLRAPFVDVSSCPSKDDKAAEQMANTGDSQSTAPNEARSQGQCEPATESDCRPSPNSRSILRDDSPPNAVFRRPRPEPAAPNPEQLAPEPAQSTVDTGPSKSRLSIASKPGRPSEWVANILKSWENPVFHPAEASLRTMSQNYDISKTTHRCSAPILNEASGPSAPLLGRIHRDDLKKADVVGQLDKKFILVKLRLDTPDPPSTDPGDAALLVVVDQHAADERCRLEDLMKGYFHSGIAATETLQKPIHFEVSPREGILFRRFRAHFEHWGIFYNMASADAAPPRGALPSSTIRITGLPPSILERCRQDPRLPIYLLRDEIHALEDRASIATSPGPAPSDWVAAFRGCPRGILDLLNSRACRGAIMFNDELSAGECEALLSKLAGCAFPFQCAHGRPSMVPITQVGEWGTWQEKTIGGTDDGNIWKGWLQRRNGNQ